MISQDSFSFTWFFLHATYVPVCPYTFYSSSNVVILPIIYFHVISFFFFLQDSFFFPSDSSHATLHTIYFPMWFYKFFYSHDFLHILRSSSHVTLHAVYFHVWFYKAHFSSHVILHIRTSLHVALHIVYIRGRFYKIHFSSRFVSHVWFSPRSPTLVISHDLFIKHDFKVWIFTCEFIFCTMPYLRTRDSYTVHLFLCDWTFQLDFLCNSTYILNWFPHVILHMLYVGQHVILQDWGKMKGNTN